MGKALWVQIRDAKSPPAVRKPNRIRASTPARAKERRNYNAEVKEWLKGKDCAVAAALNWGKTKATQCHHKNGRRGKLLLYKPFWVPVSAKGHFWIDSNPVRARELGLLCDLGGYNNQSLVKDSEP